MQKHTNNKPKAVIGLGASAGGLESLERFFDGLSNSFDATFIIIQHLSPNYETMMDRLISRHTHMPVTIATQGERLEANHVYVLPPNNDLVVEGDYLRLTPQDRNEVPHLPIDRFFESIAKHWGDCSAAIVFSGTGSDGSRGVVHVHHAGGFVMVESETTAKFTGMPVAAAATGVVDYALPPESMATRLLDRFADNDYEQQANDDHYHILDLLQAHCHINFRHYKSSTVSRRIDRRMSLSGMSSLKKYIQLLESKPSELELLYQDMLIGVTRFFRDLTCFKYLERDVIPRFFRDGERDRVIRVWVAGCATGEEAYSLAILFDEARQRLDATRDFKIFASDVHPESLKRAAAALYSDETLSNVSAERREKYFVPHEGNFAVCKDLRSQVVFTSHNVLQDPPFTDLDMVTCRNLLIYFDQSGQHKALSMFHFGLRKGGVLFLGPSESTGTLKQEFAPLDERCKVFIKRRDAKLPLNVELPVKLVPNVVFNTLSDRTPRADVRSRMRRYDRLIDKLLPPTILLNSRREVLECFGGIESLLRVPSREFSRDIVDLLPRNLHASFSALFRRVEKDHCSVMAPVSGIDFGDGKPQSLHVHIEPLPGNADEEQIFALQFRMDGQTPSSTEKLPQKWSDVQLIDAPLEARDLHGRLRTLEDELHHSRANLQSTIEELESSNEELQSTNEELISSNEELQSTNEELNSVNEELHTVNIEYQSKNEELRQLNRDMNQLFASTDIGTIFLDEALRIRRFTPRIAKIFDLQEIDVGRPLASFSHTLSIRDLEDRIKSVLETGESFEQEVRDRDKNFYLLRILPYYFEASVVGVVVTLTDVSSLVEARRLKKQLQERLQEIIDSIPVFVSYVNDQEMYEYANKAYNKWLNPEGGTVVGKSIREVLGESGYEHSRKHILAALQGETQNFEATIKTFAGETIILNVSYVPSIDEAGKVVGFYVSGSDITASKQTEKKLAIAVELAKKANQAKSDFLAKMSHEIRSPMTAILGFTDILDQQLADPDNRNAVDVIRRNGEHLLAIINDILDLSRIESGRLELDKNSFDMISTLKECYNTVMLKADAGNVRLLFAVEPSTSWGFEGDRRRLQQIVLNFLTNAIKFSAGGQVKLHCRRSEQFVHISVEDTGCGIPAEYLQRIYEPFSQAEDSNDRRYEGTGLGLTICKQLADQMNGQIEIQSTVGSGSTFKLTLPWKDASQDCHERDDLSLAKRGVRLDGKHILVIDDRRDMRYIAEHILSEAGSKVDTADDGESGVALSNKQIRENVPYDAIVTDIQMPGMDGYETAKQLRLGGFRGPILALSASAMQEDRDKALSSGCTEHFAKPINRKRFLQTINELIDSIK